MKIKAYQLKKNDVINTFLIQIGSSFYEMNAFAIQPNGVCMYAGEISDPQYHWDRLRSNYNEFKLDDLPKQTLWAIIEVMVRSINNAYNHLHLILNNNENYPVLQLTIYQYLREDNSFAVTFGNMTIKFNDNDSDKSKDIPRIFWDDTQLTNDKAFKQIDRGKIPHSATIMVIRQLQIYTDRIMDRMRKAILTIK